MSVQGDTRQRLAAAIDQAAAADVADLVDEARLQARTKARAILADAIAERLLDLAEAELQRLSPELAVPPRRSAGGDVSQRRAGTASGGSGASAAGSGGARDNRAETVGASAPEGEDHGSQGLGCYVYGVVGAGADLTPGVIGIDGVNEVFLLSGESIAAVASHVSLEEFGEETLQAHLDDLAWLERHARRHEQILEGVGQQVTLVPMRLCTIYHDERSVREMLAREHAFLADALDRLDGRTEWGVKMYLVSEFSEAVAQDAGEDDAVGDRAQGPGASYLMEKRREDRRRERVEAAVEDRCAWVHRELAHKAVEAKLNPVQPRELADRDEPMVFNGVYLVDDTDTDSFTSTFADLQIDLSEHGLDLELTGPWPPYNFVNSPTEVGR